MNVSSIDLCWRFLNTPRTGRWGHSKICKSLSCTSTYLDFNGAAQFEQETTHGDEHLVRGVTAVNLVGCAVVIKRMEVSGLLVSEMDGLGWGAWRASKRPTFTVAFHSTGGVDGVTKKTIARHLQTHNTSAYRTSE